ncbi:hypothetical protein E2562_039118 [Oryza meyeriana var. granulata]|uniref:Uncharacterized protein n=1 Tax=Oryza meyeriana var. granulata TaxID=110450 RepID=A0A6G1E9B2_9ORYZ|nr:hypothetical protein E2562_039118 [Oryza meyeriana var. granulata]
MSMNEHGTREDEAARCCVRESWCGCGALARGRVHDATQGSVAVVSWVVRAARRVGAWHDRTCLS